MGWPAPNVAHFCRQANALPRLLHLDVVPEAASGRQQQLKAKELKSKANAGPDGGADDDDLVKEGPTQVRIWRSLARACMGPGLRRNDLRKGNDE